MFKSETFGRAFWVDDKLDFRSCPLKVNNKPDLTQVDYVEEWQDMEGLDLKMLLIIHKIVLLNKLKLDDIIHYSEFNLTEDVYKEVKKCYNNDNLEDNYSYIDSLLTTGI